jgi:hypothetical protein
VELKNILARQPGPEVAEQVALYQGSLRDKTKQLKAMAAELNMAQAQVRARAPPGGGRRWDALSMKRKGALSLGLHAALKVISCGTRCWWPGCKSNLRAPCSGPGQTLVKPLLNRSRSTSMRLNG